MKLTKILLLCFVLFAASCSDDDDAKPKAGKNSFSLAGKTQVISVPDAMLQSNDPNAQAAAAYVMQANLMTGYLALADVPQGATKSSSRIIAANGRANDDGYTTYTWEDKSSGHKLAYQISEQNSKNVFEIFFMFPDQPEWLRYFHAEEEKDQSEGSMEVFDVFSDPNASTPIIVYKWVRSGNNFNMTMAIPEADVLTEININEKTKAGSVTHYVDGDKVSFMSWDAAGNGSWAYYDEGEVTEEGDWTI